MIEGNVVEWYEKSFRENRELPALVDYFSKEQYSYFDMAQEIAKLHLVFRYSRVKKGDKISLVGRNTSRWCIAYLATITYGAVIVPILQDFKPDDVHHIVNHSDSAILFLSDNIWENIEPRRIENVNAVFSLTDFSCLHETRKGKITNYQKNIDKYFRMAYAQGFTSDSIKYDRIANDELMLLNYTSGTTGFSKGVMLTANNLSGNVMFGMSYDLHFRGSRALSFLPLAHAYGCAFDFLLPLAQGGCVTLLGKIPTPTILLKALSEVKPDLICCVPLIIEKIYKKQLKPMLDKDLMRIAMNIPIINGQIYNKVRQKLTAAFGGNFKYFILGGAPLNSEVEDFLRKIKFPFTIGYGMTECAPLISYTPAEEFILTSCGRPLEGLMNARIDSLDPENIAGEICVWGEHVMKGYYKNPEATAEVLDSDGLFHTGDMGTMGADGTLYIRGRCKSMILSSSGQNIYPEEIEAKYNNMPYVMESLIVEREGRLVALIYPDHEQLDKDSIDQNKVNDIFENIRKEVNKNIAGYEQVSSFVIYPTEFERTPKKSIKRYLYTI